MLLLCALIVGSSSVWADTAGYTPSSALSSSSGTVTGTAGETWSYSITWHEDSYYGYASTYGWQIGAGKSNNNKNRGCEAFSISTSDITGTITKIEVEAGSYQANSVINVTVGGSAFGIQGQATNSGQGALKSTFTGSASGEIIISATDAVRAFYLKSIIVTYTPSAGGVVAQPTFSPAAGPVAVGTTVSLLHDDADEIRYTLDGTNPTKTEGFVYSSLNPIAITSPITIKAIAVKDDNISSVATAAYTIDVTAPTPNLEAGSYLEGTALTFTSAGNTIYYTTDNSNPTNTSTEYEGPIAISSGKITYKAIAYDAYNNASSVVTNNYTGIAPASLPFSWAGGTGTNLVKETGVVGNSLGDYANTQGIYRTQLNATNDYIEIFMNAQPSKVSIGVKMVGGSSTSKITVQESTNGATFTDVEELTISGSQNDIVNLETTEGFTATTRVIKLLFTKGSNVGVGPISITNAGPADPTTSGEVTYLTTSDNMAGWRAFYDKDNSYSVDGNTKVYVADADPVGTTITLKKIDGIPANVPVILHTSSSADSHKMTLTKETVSPYSYTDDNKLSWETTAVTDKYRLGFGASGVGFYPYSGTPVSGAVILNVDSSTAGARELTIGFEDETTSLNEELRMKNEKYNAIYNLAGQRVAQPTRGLYIVNGKKVIVK